MQVSGIEVKARDPRLESPGCAAGWRLEPIGCVGVITYAQMLLFALLAVGATTLQSESKTQSD